MSEISTYEALMRCIHAVRLKSIRDNAKMTYFRHLLLNYTFEKTCTTNFKVVLSRLHHGIHLKVF